MLISGLVALALGSVTPAGDVAGTGAQSPVDVPVKQPFRLTEEIHDLALAVKKECARPRLRAGVFVVEPSSGKYVSRSGKDSFAAASMIKIPVLVKLLAALDKRQVSADQLLTVRSDLTAGGSGFLQWRPVGSTVSVKEAAELMITNSDNTATNLIIELLGGKDALNEDFLAWGLVETRINNWLPDFEGTNKTSPYDLAYLLAKIDQGGLISKESRDFMYGIMERVRTRTLLPMGLGAGARIAHKTGDIAMMVGDAGIVTTPAGCRYMIAVQVERPHNDRRANQLVRDVSKIVYQYMTQGPAAPAHMK
jgi:beta-lactamase class A